MSHALAPGDEIAGYRVAALMGASSLGTLARATGVELGEDVVIKVLRPEFARDRLIRSRFVRDIGFVRRARLPNVLPVLDAGEDEEMLFVVSPYLEGPHLRELLEIRGRLTAAEAGAVVAGVAAALDAAHAGGLVHQAVRPGNILLEGGDPRAHVYLNDFGSSWIFGESSVPIRPGTDPGFFYASPEQRRGEPVGPAADIYALACVLCELSTGRPPFADRRGIGVEIAHLSEQPPRLSALQRKLPRALDAVVGRALAKEPDRRFASAGGFAAEVCAALRM